MGLTNALLVADVAHTRFKPKQHSFNYGVYYLSFSLGDLPRLASSIFSLERWNLFSFYNRDHGARDGSPLDTWIKNLLSEYKLTECDGDIVLVTLPRILGYIFNPVSFWFCYDREDNLRAVLSEVSNTFGEHHSYISFHDDHRPIKPEEWLQADKLFHVSPFFPVSGHYKFRFECTATQVTVHINYFDEGKMVLTTSIAGKREPLTTARLLKIFFCRPLLIFKVIGMIHFEAIRLLLKGARYHKKPVPHPIKITK